MTDDLERKLDELLGMKKQLDKLTADTQKSSVTSTFDEERRKLLRRFWFWCGISTLIAATGLVAMMQTDGRLQAFWLFLAIDGSLNVVLIKLWYHAMASKLTILQEMKQLELRMTMMLERRIDGPAE
jgi:hypothetical protein